MKVFRRLFINILLYHDTYIFKTCWTMCNSKLWIWGRAAKLCNILGECYQPSRCDPDWDSCSWKRWLYNEKTMLVELCWVTHPVGRNQGYLHPGTRWHSNLTMKSHRLLMKEMHAGGYKVKPLTFEEKLLAELPIIWLVIPNICCLCCYTT